MAIPPKPPDGGKRPGPSLGNIIAYAIMIALGLLALAPLLSVLS